MEFAAGTKEWIKSERNNKIIAPNVLYVVYNRKTISFAYRSGYNNKHKKQVILLLIADAKNDIILL